MAVEKWLDSVATIQKEMEMVAQQMEAGEKEAYNLTTQKVVFSQLAQLLAEVPRFVERGLVKT